MISTGFFFTSLLRKLDLDCICDIGSCDGTQAQMFKKASPKAHVIAFEANPYNFEKMKNCENLLDVEVQDIAISNFNGLSAFHIVDVDYTENEDHGDVTRGMSSLVQRNDAPIREKIEVKTTKLDTFLMEHNKFFHKLALWIDIEGAGFEVLEGAKEILDKVWLINIEIDKFNISQNTKIKTKDEIEKLFEDNGFVNIASNEGMCTDTIDVVYANTLYLNEIEPHITSSKIKEWAIYGLKLNKILLMFNQKQGMKIKNFISKYIA